MPVKKSARPKSPVKRAPSRGIKRRSSTSKSEEPSNKKSAISRTKSFFPIQTLHEFMEQKCPEGEVKSEAAVLLCGLMEYLAAELLELSINVGRSHVKNPDSSTILVKASDVETAVQSDEELRELMNKVSGNKGA